MAFTIVQDPDFTNKTDAIPYVFWISSPSIDGVDTKDENYDYELSNFTGADDDQPSGLSPFHFIIWGPTEDLSLMLRSWTWA